MKIREYARPSVASSVKTVQMINNTRGPVELCGGLIKFTAMPFGGFEAGPFK